LPEQRDDRPLICRLGLAHNSSAKPIGWIELGHRPRHRRLPRPKGPADPLDRVGAEALGPPPPHLLDHPRPQPPSERSRTRRPPHRVVLDPPPRADPVLAPLPPEPEPAPPLEPREVARRPQPRPQLPHGDATLVDAPQPVRPHPERDLEEPPHPLL